jgi:heterokaryon incompatibility protein (HET)
MSFQHQELKYEPFEICLFIFEPAGDDKMPVSIKLAYFTLLEKPIYYALSYTWDQPSKDFPESWDDPNCTESIFVKGKPFGFRKNVYSALTHFRHINPTTVWWIDAISIDQSSIMERNAVVQHMGKIFAGCTAAIIWLGESDSDQCSLASDTISSMCESIDKRGELLKSELSPHEEESKYLK